MATMMATAQAISLRLVQEDRGVAVDRADLDRAGRTAACGRSDRRGAEHDQAAVLQDQRDAQGDDQLAEMTLVERARRAQAGHARDQELVQQRAAREHDGTGQHRADEGADIRAEERQHAAAGDQIEAGEHAQHQQFALGEVDDPHDAEDQPEADAHQSVDAADRDARGQRVQHVLDENLEVHLVSAASRTRLPAWAASVSCTCNCVLYPAPPPANPRARTG